MSAPIDRWNKPESYPKNWEERSKVAAKRIRPGESVLDVGSGSMVLHGLIPETCFYFSMDATDKWGATYILDLNAATLPDFPGPFDVVTMIGVIEYIHDTERLFDRVAACASKGIVLTYAAENWMPDIDRAYNGWVNTLKTGDILNSMKVRGFKCVGGYDNWHNHLVARFDKI